MNKQGTNGIEWTHVFGPGTGYTWNPVGGCQHGCTWQMPDGSKAICYAKAAADKMRSDAFYPQGFEQHYFHPDRLFEPIAHKQPAGIFLDSMSDLMGQWVKDEEINQVLDVCRQTPQHIYFLLTKNAPRLKRFTFPSNVWVGASVPPSEMFGHRLTYAQQEAMLLATLRTLAKVDVPVRWLSIEPLSFPVALPLLSPGIKIEWAVIGAASNGRKTYQPAPAWTADTIRALDEMGAAVFFKGNLKWLHWRAEFPKFATAEHAAKIGE